jgi:4a-hydroxytetrahydrobiopterin dehydratase
MALLETSEIRDQMRTIPSWTLLDRMIQRIYEFPDFVGAMVFVNAIALHAEDVQHHPDIDIRWNKVTLTLTTHDAGGLTLMDFEVARQADGISG